VTRFKKIEAKYSAVYFDSH